MARVKRTFTFEFDRDEIAVLLKLTGRESGASIQELGLDMDAHDRVYDALSTAAYAPLFKDAV